MRIAGSQEGRTGMRVLIVTAEFSWVSPDVERLLLSHANGLWQVDGLLETFWMRDGNTFGIQQVFDEPAAAYAYLCGPMLKRLSAHSNCIDLFVREFDSVDELNMLSRSETCERAVEPRHAVAV